MNIGFLCFKVLPTPCSISSPTVYSAQLMPLPLPHSSMGQTLPFGVLTDLTALAGNVWLAMSST